MRLIVAVVLAPAHEVATYRYSRHLHSGHNGKLDSLGAGAEDRPSHL